MTGYKSLRRTLRPVKRIALGARVRGVELVHSLRRGELGTPAWLVSSEIKYGGMVTDVARNKVSPLDQRSPAELAFGGMTGGDRMLHHGYADVYARHLKPFVGKSGLTLAEFGILTGTGLAIWCDLFSDARVLGFDIDLSHFSTNRPKLEHRGAFTRNAPAVHEYDQLADGADRLTKPLSGRTLDIVIDDGLHSLPAIIQTWRSVRPHLSRRFVYFVEDFEGLLDRAGDEFSGFDCRAFGMMTVISSGVANGL